MDARILRDLADVYQITLTQDVGGTREVETLQKASVRCSLVDLGTSASVHDGIRQVQHRADIYFRSPTSDGLDLRFRTHRLVIRGRKWEPTGDPKKIGKWPRTWSVFTCLDVTDQVQPTAV